MFPLYLFRMVRKYKPKTLRANTSEEVIESAVREILSKRISYRSASLKYQIPLTTLFHRVSVAKKFQTSTPLDNTDSDSGNEDPVHDVKSRTLDGRKKYSSRQIFTDSEENSLSDYLVKSSRICYGLSYSQAQKLAYDYAIKNNKVIPISWRQNETAGIDWMRSFMQRHPTLSLRKPENTSIARATAFNKHNVDEFFINYVTVQSKYSFTPDRIVNLDESGITTVLQSPKVIAETSKKQVGQIVSAERGELVTFVGIVTATGTAIPPAYIFPRVRNKDHFLAGAPPGSLGLASQSGWMKAELFMEVLKHIKKHMSCSENHRILLLVDNHISHVSYETIEYASKNGMVVLSFPPHCTHRLQPLDVGIFGPFKNYLKTSFKNFTTANPGRAISIADIATLSYDPYLRAFSMMNILAAFKSTGIYPLNQNIFDETDFAAAFATDRPMPDDLPNKQTDAQSSNHHVAIINNEAEVNPTNVSEKSLDKTCTPEMVRPFPKAGARKITKRVRIRSTIYTDTPEKLKLLEKRQKKQIVTKATKIKSKVKVVTSSETSDSDGVFSTKESCDSMGSFGDDDNLTDSEAELKTLLDSDPIILEDFVLVRCDANSFYVGQVVRVVDSNDFDIKFMRKNGNYFVYPLIEDISQILRSEIYAILPKPTHMPGTSRMSARYHINQNLNHLNIR